MTTLKRKDIVPGLKINHLGTIYQVEEVKYRKCIKGKMADKVKILNPETGFIGEYKVSLLLKHSRKVEG